MPPGPEEIAAGLSQALSQALGPELAELRQELGALRDELQRCRREQERLRQALMAASEAPTAPAASAMAAALARSGPRLNREVWRRLEGGASGEHDTDVDLLIDRLHDLALEHGAPGASGAASAEPPPAD